MMQERLALYQAKNDRKLPKRILVYRDGVSEVCLLDSGWYVHTQLTLHQGQYHQVIDQELPKIRAAFTKFNTATNTYKPKLTIVVCGKRHHTRFYPTSFDNADSKGNPRPGTCVDRGVTSIYNFDFFLQAHGGLQGTTRPTHYFVVHDEIGFKADEIQELTHSVSYMFARATKAVSLVSPAYYADLACERGRCYLYGLLTGHSSVDTATSTSAGSKSKKGEISEQEKQVMDEAKREWGKGVGGKALKDTMFYL